MGKKGFIGFLLADGIFGIVVLAIVIIIAYIATTAVPVLCWYGGSLARDTGPLCWWVQFIVLILILRKVLPIGK